MSELFFVFDVESVGLRGEGFAAAWWVVDRRGRHVASDCYHCAPEKAQGAPEDLEWVRANVTLPPQSQNVHHPRHVRSEFWRAWEHAKSRGATLWADCNWPVETNFLEACIVDEPTRAESAPYPFLDLSGVLLAAGKNPIGSFGRTKEEMPAHNPLNDARQSARVLIETLRELEKIA